MLITLSALLAASLMQAEATPSPQPAREKKICRVDEANTGSRLARKVCKTASEWQAVEQKRAGGIEKIDRGSLRGAQ